MDDLLSRVSAMEQAMTEASAALTQLQQALTRYQAALPLLEQLEDYYQSPLWLADWDADHQGLLPPGMPRGVLSQDGLYNLLCEQQTVRRQLSALLAAQSDT